MSGDDVIVLEHVSKRYRGFLAVEDANFSIARGEFFAMLGPSGCGKTTTLRMIAGFETPTTGVIRLEGEDVSHVPPYRRNVNTVFQQYALFPHMTVRENVAFGPKSLRVDKSEVNRRVDEMLEVVRLTDFAKRKPAQLSGGQQQRVALARALVNQPSALLLDEPLGALDLKLRQAMQIELKRIQREVGITFIFVTHDQEEALTMSDRIAVMSEGLVEQIGTPEDIYNEPATAFVGAFIGSANMCKARVIERSGSDGIVEVAGVRMAVPVSGAATRLDPGEMTTVMIRPELVRVFDHAPRDGSTAIPATVTDLTFQGPVVRVALTAAGGVDLVAHVGNGVLPDVRSGTQVWVTFDPRAARLLAPREAEPVVQERADRELT